MFKLLKYFKGNIKDTLFAPLSKLIEALLELSIPLIVGKIVDVGIKNSDTSYVTKMVLLMIAIGVVGLSFSIIGQYFSALSSTSFVSKIRQDLFKHLNYLSFSDIDKISTSNLISILTNDMNTLQNGVNLTLRLFLRSPFVVFGAGILSSIISGKMIFINIAVISFLFVLVFFIMLSTIPMYKKTQESFDKIVVATREALNGSRVIRAFTEEERVNCEYSETLNKYNKSINKVSKVSSLLNPLTYIVINLGIIALLFVSSKEVYNGNLLRGEAISLYNYMSLILVELIKFASLIITITKAIASGNRIEEVFKLNERSISKDSINTSINTNSLVVFDNVSFKYNNSLEYALSNISFSTNNGEIIGIIGSTASGKSTLVNLLNGSYYPTEGNIYLNGCNILSITKEEINNIVVLNRQKASLFKGTIRENIKVGNAFATDEEIYNSLDIACCIDILDSTDNLLDYEITTNGANLSGGQRQRVALARSLVSKSSILVLDDSTSALDYITEKKFLSAIFKLKKFKNIFIVSQRTSSISHCDKIIVLDEGRMIGFGNHEYLLNNNEYYKKIHDSQN